MIIPGSETTLQAKAWELTAPIVKEAVRRVQHGIDLNGLIGDTTLTAADAITLRRLSAAGQIVIAKKVDAQEKDAKPKNISMRIFKIAEADRAGLKHGMVRVDAGSLADFLSSPMRASILKIETPESAKKKREKAASQTAISSYAEYGKSLMPVPRKEKDVGESKGSCFYEAVSYMLYGTAGAHHVIRGFVMDVEAELKEQHAAFVPDESVEEHITAHRKPNTWADHFEVHHAHVGYGFGVVIHERSNCPSGGKVRVSYPPVGDETRSVDLSYLPGLHYRAMEAFGAPHSPLLSTQPGVFEALCLKELRATSSPAAASTATVEVPPPL
mmetsp:Transcript_58155/g.109600  ORF Transcript_58155/g.109600 Transcript_58155/m.109600 type:complete len:328 (-) Transcript_58155:12-995(-)